MAPQLLFVKVILPKTKQHASKYQSYFLLFLQEVKHAMSGMCAQWLGRSKPVQLNYLLIRPGNLVASYWGRKWWRTKTSAGCFFRHSCFCMSVFYMCMLSIEQTEKVLKHASDSRSKSLMILAMYLCIRNILVMVPCWNSSMLCLVFVGLMTMDLIGPFGMFHFKILPIWTIVSVCFSFNQTVWLCGLAFPLICDNKKDSFGIFDSS